MPCGAPCLPRPTSVPMVNSMKTPSPSECSHGPRDEGELRRALEQAGWRFTRQRAAVYMFLRSAECHPPAEQVFAGVRQKIPHISLATVYKALEALVDANLAGRAPDEHGPTRYDGRSDAHY